MRCKWPLRNTTQMSAFLIGCMSAHRCCSCRCTRQAMSPQFYHTPQNRQGHQGPPGILPDLYKIVRRVQSGASSVKALGSPIEGPRRYVSANSCTSTCSATLHDSIVHITASTQSRAGDAMALLRFFVEIPFFCQGSKHLSKLFIKELCKMIIVWSPPLNFSRVWQAGCSQLLDIAKPRCHVF